MPSSVLERVGFRSTARDRRLRLGFGDVLSVAALLAIGSVTHGIDPLRQPLAIAETIVPFLLGWLVVAPLAGAYADDALETASRAAVVAAVTWVAAANVGLILRSSPAFDGGSIWPFNLVITGLGLVVLVTWRVGYTLVAGGRGMDGGP